MKEKSINLNGRLLSLKSPVVMGILNVTPDSFYAGSRQADEAAVAQRIETKAEQSSTSEDIRLVRMRLRLQRRTNGNGLNPL